MGKYFRIKATREERYIMNKIYLGIMAALQLIVGALATIYLIKVLLGDIITMSLWIAILAAILGITLGVGNLIKLKNN